MRTILIGISILFLGLSAVFGYLNHGKVQDLRSEVATSTAAREAAERMRITKERDLKSGGGAANPANAKTSDAQAQTAAAEAALIKAQTEKADLQSRLAANEARLAQLQKQIDQGVAIAAPPGPSTAELQAQLEDLRRQLETAEKEKALLADKAKPQPDRSVVAEAPVKRREPARSNAGVRGTVLAVNQAYNFVVLNLGARSGVERNAEMLVVRGGSSIGKIVVSSVEPATAIGDIVTNSLARGVQVQPGDTVIYAGSSSSIP
jgi:hypothetical protein